MHPDGSYVNNGACTQLAGRGYTTLCADSIFLRRGQDYYGYEQHAPGIASGINFLKNPANVDGIGSLFHGPFMRMTGSCYSKTVPQPIGCISRWGQV
jgi:hypothetical protein